MQSANEGEVSPVTEVYLYEQKELLRRQISGRTDQTILNLFSADDRASVPADDETVISLVGDSDDESGGDTDACSDVAAAGTPVAMNINVSVTNGTGHGLDDYTCVRKCGFYPLGISYQNNVMVFEKSMMTTF